MSEDAISAIRMKAQLVRRLSGETSNPGAKTRLLEIASLLDADADRLEIPGRQADAAERLSD